ncbi:hypothetical protein Oscil6304_3016 [Oscillatoria acuminata PCC 6304]|uniref:Uncharacterized protein n=1 Tax=Oscillatoria acuminata PCC 6304 TaxID=56110 RepID=K9TIC4_9CYAN|nr:hypothetical protein Oscil6304_3016 [Oscillatoria acuminata PCC 6304]
MCSVRKDAGLLIVLTGFGGKRFNPQTLSVATILGRLQINQNPF